LSLARFVEQINNFSLFKGLLYHVLVVLLSSYLGIALCLVIKFSYYDT